MSKVFEERDFKEEFINIVLEAIDNECDSFNECYMDNFVRLRHSIIDYTCDLLTKDDIKKITILVYESNNYSFVEFFIAINKYLGPGKCLHGLLEECDICSFNINSYKSLVKYIG